MEDDIEYVMISAEDYNEELKKKIREIFIEQNLCGKLHSLIQDRLYESPFSKDTIEVTIDITYLLGTFKNIQDYTGIKQSFVHQLCVESIKSNKAVLEVKRDRSDFRKVKYEIELSTVKKVHKSAMN